MKLITFVVPSYNSESYLHKCVDSLLVAKDFCQIIIVNDGSKDKTGEIADRYAAEYPDCVLALHQENGGHGEGINNGLRHAEGLYFKVVDSDDWVDPTAMKQVTDKLGELEKDGGVDLMVCNYVYEHVDNGKQQVIRWGNALPEGRILSWNDTRHFRVTQQLSLHSCIYRTELLKNCGLTLPKHCFYEDNLFVYYPLPFVKKLYYIDADFYRYYVGRPGQSVSKEKLIKQAGDQRLISELVFASHDIDAIRKENPKLATYMHHSMSFLMIIGVMFTRLNGKESEKDLKAFWKKIRERDPKRGKKMYWFSRSGVLILSIPGAFGRGVCRFFYWLSHLVVRFN